MQKNFHRSQTVPRDELLRLSQRDGRFAAVRFAVHQLALWTSAAALVWAAYAGVWWLMALAAIVCGLMVTAAFAPLHETSHQTAFATRRTNNAVGLVAGFPLLFPPALYKDFHFAHHRYTHDPERDPEISAGGERFAMWPVYAHEYLAVASGLLLLGLRLATLIALAIGPTDGVWRRHFAFMRTPNRRRAVRQARLYVAIFAALIAAGVFWLPALAALLLALWIGHAVLALYLASEHTGLPIEGTVLDRTRTTLTNPLVRFFMWNMPFHAEHHAYPSVPFHALPKLHRRIEDELVHTAPGYLRLHAGVAKGLRLWRKSP